MTSKRFRQVMRGFRHPSELDLLMFLDGELSERRGRQIERHLRTCWSCRIERESIEAAIRRFMNSRSAEIEQEPPLHDWTRFPSLLEKALSEKPQPAPGRNRLPALNIERWRWAAAGVAVAAFVIWSQWGVPRVSAQTFLERATTAELQVDPAIKNPVVHRKLRLRRTGTGRTPDSTALLETWIDVERSDVRQKSEGPLWAELRRVLNDNRLDSQRPLSAAAFGSWRQTLPARRDMVSSALLPDGSRTLVLRTSPASAAPVDSIVEASLEVRTRDWRPVRGGFQVQAHAGIQTYEVSEISYEVAPKAALDASIFNPEPAAPALAASPAPRVEIPAAQQPAIADMEVQALAGLHRARACLGEPIEISATDDGWVLVRGVVDTGQRREEIRAALSGLPSVRIEIDLFSNAPPDAASPAAAALPAAADAAPSLFEKLADARLPNERVSEVSGALLGLSEDWLAEAWALRKLGEAFPEDRISRLSPASRKLLAQMASEHGAALAARLAECQTELGRYLAVERPAASTLSHPEAWSASVRQIFDSADRAAAGVRALCARSAQTNQPAEDLARQLLTALSEAHERSALLKSRATALLQVQEKEVELTRRKQ